jgi:MFS family permease
MSEAGRPTDAFGAFRVANYRLFGPGFLASSMGLQMLGAAVGWEIYERTQDPLHLGYVGLARALPVVALALVAGHVADTRDRKKILVLTQLAFAVLALAMALASWRAMDLWVTYALLMSIGGVRAFNGPSRNSLLALLVPEAGAFRNAITWNGNLFQLAATIGPVLAGVLLHSVGGAWAVYACTSAGCLALAVLVACTSPAPQDRGASKALTWGTLFEGVGYIRQERTIFGAITLDLFAVLLGGATALLPIFAKDILLVGEVEFGALRAAPYVGALLAGLWLTRRPPFGRTGVNLLLSVAAFGALTVVFGLSKSFWLSLGALALAGAADQVSVVIRHVLVQERTPDHLRGRVSAVNAMFIECSNELGAFESGLVAKLAGPVFSAVSGGIGTLVVVAGVGWSVPEVRRLRAIEKVAS